MFQRNVDTETKRLTSPRAAAVAGILFGLLFSISLALFRTSLPDGPSPGVDWLDQGEPRLRFALGLMPFAGIAFLWFVGVVRDRLGKAEDRFVSTVFLGSSLLLLAMVFVTSGIAGALLALNRPGLASGLDPDIANFGRALMLEISNIYALRMAGVSMISLATLWLRTGTMPRWLGGLTYLLALLLLLIVSFNLWVMLVFPTWVMGVSVYFLITHPEAGQQRREMDR